MSLVDTGRLATFAPRPPQHGAALAVEASWAAQRGAAKAQLRMACGVGKTMTAVMLAQATSANLVAVVAPTLDLVRQTVDVWLPYLADGAQAVAVCGDRDLMSGARRGGSAPRVSTGDPGRIGYLLQSGAPTLLVSTYASLDRLAKAVRDVRRPLDLLVLDEAHHVTGTVSAQQAGAIDDALLPSARRLFMTATPAIATSADRAGVSGFDVFATDAERRRAVSMEDEGTFGPVAFTYSTRQAIDDGYLVDYQVLVVARLDTPSNADRLPVIAAVAAGKDAGAKRLLTFHNRVADARAFASVLNSSGLGGMRFLAETVHGGTPAAQRRASLGRLSGGAGPGVVRAVSSARCLREGVDVCSVDAVLFAAPRSATTDIVQSVGRALRLSPGKTKGTVVIPVLLPVDDGRDDDEMLTASTWASLWKVLRALNAHDPRIAESLTAATRAFRPGVGDARTVREYEAPQWLSIIGGVSPERILSRLVTSQIPAWDASYEQLCQAVQETGSAHHLLTRTTVGQWAVTQRSLHRRGLLDPTKAARLEEVPGWFWTEDELLGHRVVDELQEYAATAGTVRDVPAGPSRFPALMARKRPGRWLAQVRRQHRDGTLAGSLESRLESLPGWTWEPLTRCDRDGVEALAAFFAWGDASAVPPGHVEGGFPLSEWVDRHGLSYLVGSLSPELHEEILAVAPQRRSSPVFAWDAHRLKFVAGMAALQQYVASGGSVAAMPTGHQEAVDGVDGLVVNLYQWCARLRWRHGQGLLDPEQAAQLEQVPGWVWCLRTRTYTEPIRLPAGVAHGQPHVARRYGCGCQPCVDTKLAYGSAHKRKQHERRAADWAPCGGAVRHVRQVMAAAPTVPVAAVAAAVGMPRSLLAECLERPESATAPEWIVERMGNLTAAEARAWCRTGSRARVVTMANEPGDAAIYARLISRLSDAGWSRPVLLTHMGYRGGSGSSMADGKPTKALVHALRLFVEGLHGRIAPPARGRSAA